MSPEFVTDTKRDWASQRLPDAPAADAVEGSMHSSAAQMARALPSHLSSSVVMTLQRSIGNHAVRHVLAPTAAAGADSEVAVQRAGGQSPGSSRLYVGNLAFSTSRQSLEAAFAQCGDVRDVNVVTDRETGQSRGFGFVTMGDERQATVAIEALNGVMLDGRAIKVNLAQGTTGGDGTGGGGLGGGRGRGGGGTGRRGGGGRY